MSSDTPSNLLARLMAPIDTLLVSGGDSRLDLALDDQRNRYGCGPVPRLSEKYLSSSTATPISGHAIRQAMLARHELIAEAGSIGIRDAFETRIDEMRHELLALLGLKLDEADVIFSPSGTGTQLQALFLVSTNMGAPLTTVVVGSDTTGSGTAFTAAGQHFSDRTSNGCRVEQGYPLDERYEDTLKIDVPLHDDQGQLHPMKTVDDMVIEAVARAVRQRRKVLLQVMDCSKLDHRGPSRCCIKESCRAWPSDVLVVIDACQFRLGRYRVRQYLADGNLVLLTGSKFFAGPAFSGVMLVPPRIAACMRGTVRKCSGLEGYSSATDWPLAWSGTRSGFTATPNFGQWLRLEAALMEMRAYFAIPDNDRFALMKTFSTEVARMIAETACLQLLPSQLADDSDELDDQEMSCRTIFPILIHRNGTMISSEACQALYQPLNRDMSFDFASDQSAVRNRSLNESCLVGQPVAMNTENGETTAALRICAGARTLTDGYGEAIGPWRQDMEQHLEKVQTTLRKLDFLLQDRAPTTTILVSSNRTALRAVA